ncbi:MAG: AMP-binding protein, partial [Verrucomicrobiota bacterium]
MTNEVPTPKYRPGFAVAVLGGVIRFVTRIMYRVRVLGHERIPATGGALFVCNHVSWVDAILVGVASRRHVRFMMFKDTYDLWCVKPWARVMGVIPISSEQRPRDMLKSLQTASTAIRQGDIVCIFAEGQITRIGQLLPFRRGFERIMKDVDAPIVPVALDGVWGSLFSFEQGRFLWKFPRHFPYPVTVSFGNPLPPSAPPAAVRQIVQELVAEAWPLRRARMMTISRAFIRTARRHPRRFAMADSQTPKISFGGALVRSVLLARRLKKIWAGQEMVGLLLPPSVGGALANYAALLCGKVPVNLNYTVSTETLASCAEQCRLKTVLTSRAFLEKVKLTMPGEVVYLEDVLGKGAPSTASASNEGGTKHAEAVPGAPSAWEKLTAFVMAFALPVSSLERALGGERKVELDDLGTVIFSSGSTGEPKGVMLSHYNILSNVEQMDQVFGMTGGDRLLGVLPFFHSFGFTATLCLPALLGVGVVFHISPLDAKTIIQAARSCGRVVTAEEHQIAGGLGGAASEALGEGYPAPIARVG